MRRRGKTGRITGLACATPAPVSFFRSRQALNQLKLRQMSHRGCSAKVDVSLINENAIMQKYQNGEWRIYIRTIGLVALAMSQKTFVARHSASHIKGKYRASRFLAQ